MDGSIVQTWMSDILHVITQGLLVPDIILLLAFIGYALFCIGSIIAEYFTERKHFKVAMPRFLAALMSANEDVVPQVIEESGLLKRQKIALLTVYDYRMLPGDALIALIKRLVNEEETRYDRISGRNNMAARVSPMLGLMGTLIPLGPGIQALGSANTELLSASLLIAFDTTVAGLVVAAICMVIGKIRSSWYGNYMSALDSGMATMLEKIEEMRAEGKIVTQEPSDYAFLFEQASKVKAVSDAKSEDKPKKRRKDDETTSSTAVPAAASAKATATAAATTTATAATAASAKATETAKTDSSAASASQPFAQGGTTSQYASTGQFGVGSAVVSGTSMSGNASLGTDNTVTGGFSSASTMPGIAAGSYQYQAADGTQAPFTYEPIIPMQPLYSDASFAPVPDPAFISDLAAAADSNPASSQTENTGPLFGTNAFQGVSAQPYSDYAYGTSAGTGAIAGLDAALSSQAYPASASQQDSLQTPSSSSWYSPKSTPGGETADSQTSTNGDSSYGGWGQKK